MATSDREDLENFLGGMSENERVRFFKEAREGLPLSRGVSMSPSGAVRREQLTSDWLRPGASLAWRAANEPGSFENRMGGVGRTALTSFGAAVSTPMAAATMIPAARSTYDQVRRDGLRGLVTSDVIPMALAAAVMKAAPTFAPAGETAVVPKGTAETTAAAGAKTHWYTKPWAKVKSASATGARWANFLARQPPKGLIYKPVEFMATKVPSAVKNIPWSKLGKAETWKNAYGKAADYVTRKFNETAVANRQRDLTRAESSYAKAKADRDAAFSEYKKAFKDPARTDAGNLGAEVHRMNGIVDSLKKDVASAKEALDGVEGKIKTDGSSTPVSTTGNPGKQMSLDDYRMAELRKAYGTDSPTSIAIRKWITDHPRTTNTAAWFIDAAMFYGAGKLRYQFSDEHAKKQDAASAASKIKEATDTAWSVTNGVSAADFGDKAALREYFRRASVALESEYELNAATTNDEDARRGMLGKALEHFYSAVDATRESPAFAELVKEYEDNSRKRAEKDVDEHFTTGQNRSAEIDRRTKELNSIPDIRKATDDFTGRYYRK